MNTSRTSLPGIRRIIRCGNQTVGVQEHYGLSCLLIPQQMARFVANFQTGGFPFRRKKWIIFVRLPGQDLGKEVFTIWRRG
jgi:hypothetical protein